MKGKRRWGVLMLVIAGLIALLMSLAVVGASAGGKGNGKKPPPEPEALAGSIYFNNRSTGTTWVMDPDGSDKKEFTSWIRYTPQDVIHVTNESTNTTLFLVNGIVENNIYPELFAVDEIGNGVQLTNLPNVRFIQAAGWSPNGKYVAFSYVRVDDEKKDEPIDVEWRNAVGQVRDDNGFFCPCNFDVFEVMPGAALAWSPDNTRLAYYDEGSIYVITVVDTAGMVIPFSQDNSKKLLSDVLDDKSDQGEGYWPPAPTDRRKGGLDWSFPTNDCSGGSILFAMSPPGETRSKDLYTGCPSEVNLIDPTSRMEVVQVTSVKAKTTNVNPRWSPDGKHMMYVAYNTAKFEFDIHRIKADGTGAVNLTKDTKAGASNVGWRCFDNPATDGPC